MEKTDFFISYTKADREWAEWIAWQLNEADYTTILQVWDFRPGSNFVLDMQRGLQQAEHTIAILSPDYFQSSFAQAEWAAALCQDPTEKNNLLIPVRVRKCEPEGLLGPIVYIDLVGLDENKCRKKILQGVSGRSNKPSRPPRFPGSIRQSSEKPSFPPAIPPVHPTFSNTRDKNRSIIRNNRLLSTAQSKAKNSNKTEFASEVPKVNAYLPVRRQNQTMALSFENIDIDAVVPLRAHAPVQRSNEFDEEGVIIPTNDEDEFGQNVDELNHGNVFKVFVRVIFAVAIISLGIVGYITLVANNHRVTFQGGQSFPINVGGSLSNVSIWQDSTGPTASKVVGLSQSDPKQYSSSQEYNTWDNSDSSAAAMAEIINAYGHHYRITDVLKVEIQLKEITPDLGLLEFAGIEHTVAKFGFKTTLSNKVTLDQIIEAANNGEPVIVDFPPSNYPGGHSLVVTGGNENDVSVVDSKNLSQHSYSHKQFMLLWGGFSAIVVPN